MPKYGRKRFGPRGSVRARVFGMDDGVSRSAAARAAAVAAVRGVVRAYPAAPGEFKSVDTTVNISADTTGGVQLLNGLARGDDIGSRVGREVVLKSIELRATGRVTDTTGTDQTQRILVVYDRQANAAAPAIADVLAAANVLYPRNLENRRRFKILFDRSYTLNASGEAGSQKHMKWYRRLDHPVVFNSGNAGTVADITSGSLYAMVLGNNAPGVTAGTVSGRVRVRFLDR